MMGLWILLYIITFVAAIIRGAVGMGFALIVIPFYLIVDPDMVPSTIIMLGLLLSVLVVLRDRKALDGKGLKYSLLGRFVGSILSAGFISYLSGTVFDIVVAAMILVAIVLSLLPWQLDLTRKSLLLAGFGSGVMGTISSLDGPPIALLYQHQKGEVIRATLAGYFIVGAAFSLLALGFAGRVNLHSFYHFLLLAPPAVFGFLLSKHLIGILKESLVRYAILSISGVSALLILGKAFWS
jgi:uncharacterized protein